MGEHATAGEKYTQILVVVDYRARYVFLAPVKGHQPEKVVSAFHNRIVPMTGLPKVVVSDHDGAFAGEPFRSYACSLEIRVHMTTQDSTSCESGQTGMAWRVRR